MNKEILQTLAKVEVGSINLDLCAGFSSFKSGGPRNTDFSSEVHLKKKKSKSTLLGRGRPNLKIPSAQILNNLNDEAHDKNENG